MRQVAQCPRTTAFPTTGTLLPALLYPGLGTTACSAAGISHEDSDQDLKCSNCVRVYWTPYDMTGPGQ